MTQIPVGRQMPLAGAGEATSRTSIFDWIAQRYRQKRFEQIAVVFLLLLMIGFCPVAMDRAMRDGHGTDFPEFYEAGAYVIEHGQVMPGSMAAYYLPSIDAAWAAVAVMPLPMASFVWYVFGCVSWLGLLWAIYQYLLADLDDKSRRAGVLTAALISMPLVLDCLCLGAFHITMLWLMVAGMGRASRGRDVSGGILLGLAVWLKLLPMLGVCYLIGKRKWKAAIVAVVCAVVVDAGLSTVAFGPTGAWREHVAWFQRDAAGTTTALLTSTEYHREQRVTNQSTAAVFRRTLTHFGYPRGNARDVAALGNLSPSQLKATYFGFLGLLFLSIAWFCRRSGRTTSLGQWGTEISLIVLSSLWFSPIAPSYHPIAAAPALAVILSRRAYRPLAYVTMTMWLVAMALHGVPTARAFGHVLWMTMVVGAFLIWTSHAKQKQAGDTTPGDVSPSPV